MLEFACISLMIFFQTVFKLTSVFGACNQGGDIQRKNHVVKHRLRDLFTDDSLSQTFLRWPFYRHPASPMRMGLFLVFRDNI